MKNSMLAIAIAAIFVVMGCGDSGPTAVDFDSSTSGGDYAGETNGSYTPGGEFVGEPAGTLIGFGEAEKPAAGTIVGSGVGYYDDPSFGAVGHEFGEGFSPDTPAIDPLDPVEGEWSDGNLRGIAWGRHDDSVSEATFDLTNPTGDDSWGSGELSFDANELALRLYGLVESADIDYSIRVHYVNPDYSAAVVVGLDPEGFPTDRFNFDKPGQVVQGTWDDPFGGTIIDRIEVVEYDNRGGISEQIVLSASIIWDREISGDAGSKVD